MVDHQVCCEPYKLSVEDMILQGVLYGATQFLLWCEGYIFGYMMEWTYKTPQTQYIRGVMYAILPEYKEYALVEDDKVTFASSVLGASGKALSMRIFKATTDNIQVKVVMDAIKAREAKLNAQ